MTTDPDKVREQIAWLQSPKPWHKFTPKELADTLQSVLDERDELLRLNEIGRAQRNTAQAENERLRKERNFEKAAKQEYRSRIEKLEAAVQAEKMKVDYYKKYRSDHRGAIAQIVRLEAVAEALSWLCSEVERDHKLGRLSVDSEDCAKAARDELAALEDK